jgi:hypothetical protein
MRSRAVVFSSRRRTSTPSPISDYNWSGGAVSGSEAVTRSGTATYINSSGSRQTAAANTPRFNYSGEAPNAFLGLMIEPASSNIFLTPEDLTNANWDKSGFTVVNDNGGTGQGGPLDTITITGTDAKAGQELTIPVNSTITMTWILKAGTGSWVNAIIMDVPGYADSVTGWANLTTGKVSWAWHSGTKVIDAVHAVTPLANGLIKYSIKAKTVGITAVLAQLRFVNADEAETATVGQTYLFDSAQIEVSPLPGTSFIPSGSRGAETVGLPMANGSYDILVRDAGGFEWRDGVTVSGGAYALTPRVGQTHVQRVSAYAAGALTVAQKDAISGTHSFAYRDGYTLDWGDEFTDTNTARFSETGLVASSGDGKAWKAKLHYEGRQIEGESQVYTNSTYLGINPFSVSGSVLRITAGLIPEGTPGVPTNNVYVPSAPYKFYSGILTTEIAKTWTYGVFEIRCRGEAKKGVWPAFWLYSPPGTPSTQRGELDIMENIGDWPDRTALNLHEYTTTDEPDATDGSEYYFPSSSTIADWHTYAAKWEPGRVRWYVDGVLAKDMTTTWVDNAIFFLMVNLALNTSAWTGADSATGEGDPIPGEMPTYLDVDYIRVYKPPA